MTDQFSLARGRQIIMTDRFSLTMSRQIGMQENIICFKVKQEVNVLHNYFSKVATNSLRYKLEIFILQLTSDHSCELF